MKAGRWDRILTTAVNVALLVFLGVVVFGPDGMAAPRVAAWRAERESRQALAEAWPKLIAGYAENDRTVVAFTDFECPYCRVAYEVVEEARASTGLRIIYRHLPLTDIHPRAAGAARAAWCADRQGALVRMERRLYGSDTWATGPVPDWSAVAADAEVPDPPGWLACLDSPAARMAVEADRKLAAELGIDGTPTFIGPGGVHPGVPTLADLERLAGGG